jgi:hypothetical protein
MLAVAASLIVATFPSRNDDYFRHLVHVASRFAMAVIAIWFCIVTIVYVGNGAHFAGELFAGATHSGYASNEITGWFTAEMLAIVVGLAFHIRLLVERYRR